MELLVPNNTFCFVLDFLAPEEVCTIASSNAIWDPCLASKPVYDHIKKKLAVAALLRAIRDEQSPLSAGRVIGYFHATVRFDENLLDKAEDILMKRVTDKVLDSYHFLRCHAPQLSPSLFSDIAMKRLLRDAKNGDAYGQRMLGIFYEVAFGGERNEVKAVELYRLAAEQGDADGQIHLGTCYEYGRGGLEKSGVEAFRLYRLAAHRGHAGAQCHLGLCYELGRCGLARDEVEAVRLYRLAADQGNAAAQYNLVAYYEHGLGGIVRDEVEAARLIHLAVEQVALL